jgi:hypothetical protein
MGFRKPNLDPAYGSIRQSLVEIASPYNDGWTSSECKYELYRLKCFLEDSYAQLPTFLGEDEWEKERLVEILKKQS